jgi:uncharacterized membrane protein
LRTLSKDEGPRRKALFPPSPKWSVERLHKDVVSFYENRLLLTLMHKIADFHASLCPQRYDAFRCGCDLMDDDLLMAFISSHKHASQREAIRILDKNLQFSRLQLSCSIPMNGWLRNSATSRWRPRGPLESVGLRNGRVRRRPRRPVYVGHASSIMRTWGHEERERGVLLLGGCLQSGKSSRSCLRCVRG